MILPAAGQGSRVGGGEPKQFADLGGVPVLTRTAGFFAADPRCQNIVVAVSAVWRARARECLAGMAGVLFADGGAERQHSIANALAVIGEATGRDPQQADRIVLVHDAARPCVSAAVTDRVIQAAQIHGGAVPGVAVWDTIKQVDENGLVVRTLQRSGLRAVQTPQAFRYGVLCAAYQYAERSGILGTDDASLVEAMGGTVVVVEGDPDNIKITVPEDFARATAILERRKNQR